MATQEELNNQRNLNDGKRDEITLQQELLRILSQRAGISSEVLNDQQDISDVLKDQIKQYSFQNTQKQLLRSIDRDINKIAIDNYSISLKELGTAKNLTQLSKDKEKLDKNLTLLLNQQNKLKETGARLDSDVANTIQDQIELLSKLQKDLKSIEETSKSINQNLGVKGFSALESITKSIPGLKQFSDPFSRAAEASRQTAAEQLKIATAGKQQRIDALQQIAQANGKGIKKGALGEFGFGDLSGTAASSKAKSLLPGAQADLSNSLKSLETLPNALKPFISGLKQLATTLKTAMKAFVIAEFVIALIQGDKATGDLAKSMNMTYSEANKLRLELNAAANASGDIFVNTKGLQETLVAINNTLGTNVMLNKENLVTFTKLRETAGLTNEELMGVQSIVNATNGNLKQATGEILAQTKISSARLGVALNEKEVLKSIKDVSAATTLSLGKNPGLIADAVATAKALGMELSKVDQIAGSLLEFESSISSELEAELLLGKDINLEKARQAALNNDLATVAKEISKQAGSAADFGKMNRIQQEALAKSVGMGRDELAKTLFVQEQLVNISGKDAKLRESRINSLIQEKGLAEAQRVLAEEGIEGLENQASIGESFNTSMEKLKEIFVSLSPAILAIGNALIPIFTIVGDIIKVLDPMIQTTIVGVTILGDVIKMITSPLETFKKIATGDLAGLFSSTIDQIGNAEVSAKENYGFSFNTMGRAGDIISPAMGKTQISTKEGGLFELSQNDDLLAGPGLASKGTSGENNSSLIAEIRALRTALESRPINVNTTVELDGEKIGSNKNVIRGLGNRSTDLGTELSRNSSRIQ